MGEESICEHVDENAFVVHRIDQQLSVNLWVDLCLFEEPIYPLLSPEDSFKLIVSHRFVHESSQICKVLSLQELSVGVTVLEGLCVVRIGQVKVILYFCLELV